MTRPLLAVVRRGTVGFEHETTSRPAGLRTPFLMGVAVRLFSIIRQDLTRLDFGRQTAMKAGTLRLIEAVTAGMALLAAGIIFASGGRPDRAPFFSETCPPRGGGELKVSAQIGNENEWACR
ncbi:MgtC/SapB family protein [uncultured Jannaschia sp.]|uniref:MgtC/SapB family protein n=1 Tax=uncultured Jannaschia sp. TaxID=293347 RepID=UPI00261AA65A|nr:MgtC/SapB family protein [uncultured Jannaschia sp.]